MRPDQMPRQPDGELAGLPAVQRWHATGDYAYPAEEREDGEFVAYDDHRAELLRLARENAELRGSITFNQFIQTHQRLLRAESERDALRKRIDASPTCRLRLHGSFPVMDVQEVVCYDAKYMERWMRVALVPLDDAEAAP